MTDSSDDGGMIIDARMIDRGRNKLLDDNGLTREEGVFAKCVADGLSKTEAYRRAHGISSDTRAVTKGLSDKAARMAAKPMVRARISRLASMAGLKDWEDSYLVRQHIAERAWAESVDSGNPPRVRLQALELLGKLSHVGAFVERTESVSVTMTADDIRARIEALVKRAA